MTTYPLNSTSLSLVRLKDLPHFAIFETATFSLHNRLPSSAAVSH